MDEIRNLGTEITRDNLAGLVRANSNYLKRHEAILVSNEFALVEGLRVFDPRLIELLNENGLIKVGGNLFQYNEDNYKVIRDGDESKLPDMYKAESSIARLGIDVIRIQSVSGKGAASRYTHDSRVLWYVRRDLFASDIKIQGFININIVPNPVFSPTCVLVCSTPGGPTQRGPDSNCVCTYPLIGYEDYTNYTTKMVVQDWFLWEWEPYQPDKSEITVEWSVAGSPKPIRTFTSWDISTTMGTVYYGPPIDITYARHVYKIGINYNPFEDWEHHWVADQFTD